MRVKYGRVEYRRMTTYTKLLSENQGKMSKVTSSFYVQLRISIGASHGTLQNILCCEAF